MTDLVCSNCGSDNISAGSIQRGIGGLPIGFCNSCSPKKTILPSKEDRSAKAEARRARIVHEEATKTFRTVLRPLIPADQWHPREKKIAAPTLSMFEDLTP